MVPPGQRALLLQGVRAMKQNNYGFSGGADAVGEVMSRTNHSCDPNVPPLNPYSRVNVPPLNPYSCDPNVPPLNPYSAS